MAVSSEQPGPQSTREVFAGRLLTVAVESWAMGEREIVRHPAGCAVVAVTEGDEVLLVRQFREAIGAAILEVPAGLFDHPAEGGPRCAARELLEETGYRIRALQPLGSVYSSPGFTDERMELFVASVEPDGPPLEEGIELVRLPFPEAVEAARDGTITDLKTIAALLLAAARR